jgi:hypothetical protein
MATERQINANRANALKSTGPVTPEGKRVSSRNRALHKLVSGDVVLKGRFLRRYNQLATAFTFEFQPRNPVETTLVETMTLARWAVSSLWTTQTATLHREIVRLRKEHPFGSGTSLAALAFCAMAQNSRPFVQQHRLEAFYDRQYHRALAELLKLREIPDSSPNSSLDSSVVQLAAGRPR